MGGIWDVVNALLVLIGVLSFSADLFGTMGVGGAVGFGRARIALCISCIGEDGVVLAQEKKNPKMSFLAH